MSGPITILWLVDEPDPSALRDERLRHAFGNPERPAAAITSLLAQGAVVAVVRSEEEGQRALAHGADEVVLHTQILVEGFERLIERTVARARARFHREHSVTDTLRQDDTSALSLLATALGRRIVEPLAQATAESEALAEQLEGRSSPALRAHAIARTVSDVAQVVEQLRALISVGSAGEHADLREVARKVLQTVAPGVSAAELELRIVDRSCEVRMPRWQATLMIASLVADAFDFIARRAHAPGRVTVDLFVQGGAVVLEVTATGIGMLDDDSVHSSDALAPVSTRVQRAGGELMVESDPGIGRIVRVFLPLRGADPAGSQES
jgi:signal transduction histidine kinase